MGCQKSLRPSAGRTVAVIQCVNGGGQLQCEAVVGSEAVGGQLGPPADRGGGKGQSTPASPTKASTPPTIH